MLQQRGWKYQVIRLISSARKHQSTHLRPKKDTRQSDLAKFALDYKIFGEAELKDFKNDSQLAQGLLNELVQTNRTSSKYLSQLCNAASKTHFSNLDSQFWNTFQAILCQQKILKNANEISDVAMIAYCLTKLKTQNFIQSEITIDILKYIKQNINAVNAIDINQLIYFITHTSKEYQKEVDEIWELFEQRIMNNMTSFLDAKNFSIISYRFSQSKRGSMDFWKFMNYKLVQVHKDVKLRDFAYIVQSFCRMDLLDADKFCQFSLYFLHKYNVSQFSLIDISQILSSAKYVKVNQASCENAAEFWTSISKMLEQKMSSDLDKVNKQTFIVIINAIYKELDRQQYKSLWKLMDQTLLKLYDELKTNQRSSFIVIRAYLNQIELVNPGVREMILELVRYNVKYNAGSLLSQDIALAFRVAAKADPSLLKHVIPLAQIVSDELSFIDKKEIQESIEEIEQSDDVSNSVIDHDHALKDLKLKISL